MSWVEARLERGAQPMEVYEWMEYGEFNVEAPVIFHHFWDEPWWRHRYVIRVESAQANLAECPAINHLALWDERPDAELYGHKASETFGFFMASSTLHGASEWERRKLVHCYLNAQGMGRLDELRFHLRAARDTARMMWRERKLNRRRP